MLYPYGNSGRQRVKLDSCCSHLWRDNDDVTAAAAAAAGDETIIIDDVHSSTSLTTRASRVKDRRRFQHATMKLGVG